MNFEEHFINLRDFLLEHEQKWTMEIINHYPQSLESYSDQWIEYLDKLSDETLWKIDCNKDITEIAEIKNAPFYEYSARIKELTKLERNDMPAIELPLWAWDRVKLKKKHEISMLAPYLKNMCTHHNYSHAVDIGGGKGHLSRILAHYLEVPTKSIDQDEHFQSLGKKRLDKFPKPKDACAVEFINMKFGENEKDLQNIFTEDALTVGLHTCGPLANAHIEHSVKNKTKSLLNFGCCYIKLEKPQDINLSKLSKHKPLALNKFSLTLATRGHNEMSFKEFQTKQRVKFFRYALHILMVEKLGITDFLTAGNTPLRVYWESFSNYANLKLEGLQIEHTLSSEEIDSFFNEENLQKRLRKMFLANIIRWQLGRVIEHYILTDRCLYLRDNGFTPKMYEVFDPKVSPRNIAIEASRDKLP